MAPPSQPSPIAVIGLAVRLPPDIDSPKEFWEYCAQGRRSTGPVPPSRFKASSFHHPDPSKPGHFNVDAGSYLNEDVSVFDAPYFNLTEAEAIAMDPQQRLLLETTIHAIEHAGLDMHDLSGRTDVGVFAASSKSEYETRVNQDIHTASRYAAVGTAATMFANRISYFLNLRGPSINVDTACSSSLTALHLAVESIRRGECSCAIVGASFLQLSPSMLAYMCNLGTLSKDGQSHAFDARANGYGRGDGVCCIVLKSIAQAEACSDTILALIRQTGINHGGRSPGITFPNGDAQLELIKQVYASVQLSPDETDYVEGHGTGTARGDPIEANSILSAFAGPIRKHRPLYLGSIKSNFGHLENASGLPSVIKCVLMLQKHVILPSADFQSLNPDIKLQGYGLIIPTECVPWPSGIRRASVNNFGFGGSNGHVILEEYTGRRHSADEPCKKLPPHIFHLSAKDPSALSSLLKAMQVYVQSKQPQDESQFLARLSHTLCCRRTLYDYQYAVAASSQAELAQNLQAPTVMERKSVDSSAAFVFTGQGSAWAEMGVQLMRYPVFDRCMREADAFLSEKLGSGWSLLDMIGAPSSISMIRSAAISQPAVTALQIALVSQLRDWGIQPTATVGHSSGEIAAAYTAGYIDFQAALALAYYRGKTAIPHSASGDHKAKGSMIAVGAPSSQVEPLVQSLTSGFASIACYNSSKSVTVSGDESAILELQKELDFLGVFNRILEVDTAYHSDHMVSLAETYLQDIGPWLERPASRKARTSAVMFSSVTGSEIGGKEVRSPWYWVTNLVRPVKFHDALKLLLASRSVSPLAALIEIGPHGALAGPVRDTLEELKTSSQSSSTKYLSAMKRNTESCKHLLSMISALISHGYPLSLAHTSRCTTPASQQYPLGDLPGYPFNKNKRYWHRSRLVEANDHGGTPWNVILGHRQPSIGEVSQYRNVFTLDDIPWLRHHQVNGRVVFPLAGYISMVVEALSLETTSGTPTDKFRLRELTIGKALMLTEGVRHEMFTTLKPHVSETRSAKAPPYWYDFEVLSWSEETGFCEHCRGLASVQQAVKEPVSDILVQKQVAMKQLRHRIEARSQRKIAASALYKRLVQVGLHYGSTFSLVASMATGPDVATGAVVPTDASKLMPQQYENRLIIHPTLLDACLHVGSCNLSGNPGKLAGLRAHVPTFIEDMSISANPALGPLQAYFFNPITDRKAHSTSAEWACFDTSSDLPVIEIHNLRMIDVTEANSSTSDIDIINPARLQWNVHMDFLSTEVLESLAAPDMTTKSALAQRIANLEKVSLGYMDQAIRSPLAETSLPYLTLAKSRMQTEVCRATHDLSISIPSPSALQEQRDVLETGQWSTEVFVHRAGNQLQPILNEQVDSRTVLDASGLAKVYEESFVFQESANLLAQAIGILSQHNPRLRILEVGAGTGGCTTRVLERLADSTHTRFSSYHFTDISSDFFESARVKFAAWEHKMTFSVLDLGKDAASQGFHASDFDLIIATDVIHATPSIDEALSVLRSLIKPGGILAMAEPSRFSPLLFPMAMLPGWWTRPTGPVMSREEWDRALKRADFSGADTYARDFPDGRDVHCVIWSRASCLATAAAPLALTIVGEATLAPGLVNDEHFSLQYRTWDDEQEFEGIAVIEEIMTDPLLTNLSQRTLKALQRLCTTAKGVIWITRSSGSASEDALAGFALGFARTLRLEYTHLKMILVQLDDTDNKVASRQLAAIAKNAFIDKPGIDASEVDFKVVNGVIYFPRVTTDCELQQQLESASSDRIEKQPILQSGSALRATVGSAGLMDTLHFEHYLPLGSSVGDDQVLIEVRAAGMNFKDVLIALGRVSWSELGKECSGVVLAVGCNASEQFSPGDHVVHWGNGLFASHVLCHSETVVKLPPNIDLSFSQAASIPIIFATAYEALVRRACLQPGEKLLVHVAAGGVGQAAIQLAQWIGNIEIYCTVGSTEKRDMIIDQYGIEPGHIFSSRSSMALGEGLRLATQTKGFDVILNSLSGEFLLESWRALAPFGRFVEIGKRDAISNAALDMGPFDKAATYMAVDLSLLIEHKPLYAKGLLASVLELYQSKALRPIYPITTLPMSKLGDGLRLMQAGKHSGKVVIVNDASVQVDVAGGSGSTSHPNIREDAAYLITGGTGGLGRSLATWLIEQGARHIILVSRRGRIEDAADEHDLLQLAGSYGANIVVEQCDVSSLTELEKTLARSPKPVRGIIHSAMVLKDALFESAQLDDWHHVVTPKVRGALNLHHIFPGAGDLDFFVCLSSIAATSGNIGQSSYAGGNACLDSLCRWRADHGLPGISINLPAISDAGYVATAIASGEVNFTDRVYGSALTVRQITKTLSILLNTKSMGGDVVLGLSKSQEVLDLIKKSGIHFSLFSWQCSNGDERTALYAEGARPEEDNSAKRSIVQAADPESRRTATKGHIAKKISTMLMITEDDVRPDRSVADLGLDSLVAVELRNWLVRELEANVRVMEIVGCQSLQSLFDLVVSRSGLLK